MENKINPRRLPNRETHNCFGCSPINPSGLQMKFYTRDSAVFSRLTVPDHLCGWDRLVHGGVISTILDEVMSWTGIYLLKQITMTKSMTVDFIKPVYINSELKAEGLVLEKTGKHEALLEGRLYNQEDTLCARSRATFVIFSPAVAKRLGIARKEHLEWFEEIYNF
ncbi:MAG: PaaI family thioesterase [Deltaproteobacteria bacterium]|nr:PaaI family thioesterase [Deltaproteobacteria bacterium]